MILKVKKTILISTVTAAVLFTGCSVKPEKISLSNIQKDVQESISTLDKISVPVTKPITLDEAINRAVEFNLNRKVDMLNNALAEQKIDIVAYENLPSLTTQAGYSERDNYSLSQSRSYDTATGQLDTFNDSYSTSSARQSKTAGVSFSWNILDFGVSYVRANQQADRYLISKEKERKAINNIAQEVRDAYYKAVSADELLNRIKPIMIETQKAFEDSKNIKDLKLDTPIKSLTYQRELLEVIRSLNTLEESLVKSKTELSRLMGLKPGTKFSLAEKIRTDYELPEISKSVKELEKIALENRPELLETRYQERISQNEVTAAMLKMLPGINLNAGYNYEDSSYLLNNDWISYGASISWNLLNVFNGSLNKKLAKTQVELAKAQKIALSMAVITQVHMSVIDYQQAVKQYKLAKEYYSIADEIFKIIESESNLDVNGKLSLIKEKLNFLLSGLRLSSSYANVQNTYGKVIASTGKLDVFKKEAAKETPKALVASETTEVKEEPKVEEKKVEKTDLKTIETPKEEKVEENKIPVQEKEEVVQKAIETIENKDLIKVYKLADNTSEVVKTVSKDEIQILNKVFTENGYWYELADGYIPVNTEAKKAVVNSTHSTVSSSSTKLEGVAKQSLNIRSDYNLNSEIVQVLPEGESIDVIRKIYSNNGTWIQTSKGYISSELLELKTK